MIINRFYRPFLNALLRQFPVVCILGPRQCGKTTFVEQVCPSWKYLDLEQPSQKTPVEADPESFLGKFSDQVIFDEAQQLPSLFPVLRGVVDRERKKKGRFILLGSASPHLIRSISETLAGRIGFLDMNPFHLLEVGDENRLWTRGGFPDAYLAETAKEHLLWCEGYTRTFLERDLKMYGIDVNPSTMRRLWTMLAHVHGGLFNASDLGNALGINYHTVQRYVEILEETFLVRKLKPYFTNIGKRLVKTPKIYLRDTGLLHYFLNIADDEESLLNHPRCGASWEGYALEQIIQWVALHHPSAEFYFWRTATGQEAALLVKRGDHIVPIEIRRHRTPTWQNVPGLVHCMKDLKLKRGYVVAPVRENYSLQNNIEVLRLELLLQPSLWNGLE